MNKTWIYYGVFFSEPTKQFLLSKAKELIDIREDWKLYADHMTIIYNDGSEIKQKHAEILRNKIGQYQQLQITSIGISDKAIAFGISNYKTQNCQSHITIATAPNTKPVISNQIEIWKRIEGFYVTGEINFVK